MDTNAKTAIALATLSLATGCVDLNQILAPGGLSGMTAVSMPQQRLMEPNVLPEAETYETHSAYRTMDVPAILNVPDRATDFAVVSSLGSLIGHRYVSAILPGGIIVEREFGKVRDANFRKPVDGELPVATFAVRVHSAEVTQSSPDSPVDVVLHLNVEVAKPDGGEIAYSKSMEVSASAPWVDKTRVPDAFYQALFSSIAQVLGDWDQSDGPETVARWGGKALPGAVPPELHAIAWTGEGSGVHRGHCTVSCNGWGGFQTKHWANAQIAAACRTKLGDIEENRVRVLYDEESYDESRGRWTFAFRCFARNEKVLEFDAITGTGRVIGDLGLLKMTPERAARVLKDYVLSEMESHVGIVTSEHRTAEAFVRFDNYRTDETLNLITIDFRLLQ